MTGAPRERSSPVGAGAGEATTDEGKRARRAALVGLVVLTSLNLLNYFDRFIVSAVLPALRAPTGLSLTFAEEGWLAGAFMIVYTLASPALGILGDRGSRLRWIAGGVAVWSLATGLGGLAIGFGTLVVARSMVGVGEAAFGPHAPPMLSDWFPKEKRARIFSIYFSAFPFGTALGVVFGSAIERHFHWRLAFFLAGIPGLFLAFLVLRLRPAPRGANDAALPRDPRPFAVILRESLLANPPFLLTVFGYAMYSAVFGAFLHWMPTYLADRPNGSYEFGLIVAVAGLAGTLSGGAIGDHLQKKSERGYLAWSATTTLVAAGALVASLSFRGITGLAAIALFAYLLYTVTAPVNGALVNALPPEVRGAGLAFNVFTIHLLGDAWSPVAVGKISDRIGSLGEAMRLVLPPLLVGASVLWAFAAAKTKRIPD